MAVPTGMWGVAVFASHSKSKHNMETNEIDYRELARDARKELNNEFNRLSEKAERMKGYQALLDGLESLMAANRKLVEENKNLEEQLKGYGQQLAAQTEQREHLEMKLAEMEKISRGMAKKASDEAVIGFLRTYVNQSKRKTADKRAFVKQFVLDMVTANGLTLPHEQAAAIEALDDEQSDPKVVNVGNGGQYNDIHDNTTVNQK